MKHMLKKLAFPRNTPMPSNIFKNVITAEFWFNQVGIAVHKRGSFPVNIINGEYSIIKKNNQILLELFQKDGDRALYSKDLIVHSFPGSLTSTWF